ncbi:YheC/YheD family protein [Paenibacillus sp. NPDC058071]|uniref:YheC/YheD family protein n=1 Tax=Paenibacillus sp. NPDC058071 TaxID=3346326 RepID=UPI0036D76F88
MSIQHVTSKWVKTQVLLQNAQLEPYVPETMLYNRDALFHMLEKYEMVYVKPNVGTYGKGVIRVQKLEWPSQGYKYQINTTIRIFESYQAMERSLRVYTSKKRYLVQKGIHLLTHNTRRFDIRVMVQQSPSKSWEATGIIGRLSHPGKIVTNYHSGGTPMAFELLMIDHLTAEQQQEYIVRLQELGLAIARQMRLSYPRLKEIGVDIAIDTDLHPWILEVNTKPDPFIFRRLNNRSVFRKIYRYAKAYGRFKKRK